jgi:hypothetical protein
MSSTEELRDRTLRAMMDNHTFILGHWREGDVVLVVQTATEQKISLVSAEKVSASLPMERAAALLQFSQPPPNDNQFWAVGVYRDGWVFFAAKFSLTGEPGKMPKPTIDYTNN